jgi:hypothetical protein
MDASARLCLFAMARAANQDFLDRLAAWQPELRHLFASGDNELGRRFGAVPEPIAVRVSAATPPDLERWFDRVLDAGSIDDVFAGE